MKQVPDFPKYLVNELGEVFSMWVHSKNPKGLPKKMKASTNTDGYKMVRLIADDLKRSISVHRLVAVCYLGEGYDSPLQVDHIDGNKLNNKVSNLRWVTQQENLLKKYREDGHKTHFAKPTIQLSLNGEVINQYPSALDAAKSLGVDSSSISKVCRGLLSQSGGFKWLYV